MAAVAGALENKPEILLADEPTGNLDTKRSGEIGGILRSLNEKDGLTILLVTNLVQQARRLGDRTAFLNAGKLVEVDTNEVIFSEKPAHRETYDYVNGVVG